jgi:hypothetical protein
METELRLYSPPVAHSFRHAGHEVLPVLFSLSTDDTENVSSVTACSLLAGGITCSQRCSVATAFVLSPVYKTTIWQWVYMSQFIIIIIIIIIIVLIITVHPFWKMLTFRVLASYKDIRDFQCSMSVLQLKIVPLQDSLHLLMLFAVSLYIL